MKLLSARQQQVLDMLRRMPQPSYREMAVEIGITWQGVMVHVNALVAKGVVSRQPGVSRAVDVPRWPAQLVTACGRRLKRVDIGLRRRATAV